MGWVHPTIAGIARVVLCFRSPSRNHTEAARDEAEEEEDIAEGDGVASALYAGAKTV